MSEYTHHCNRCGYDWKGRTEKPSHCARCNSPNWNILARRWRCRRCGHEWTARNYTRVPDMCPSCKVGRYITLADYSAMVAGTMMGGSIAECAKDLGISSAAMAARVRRRYELAERGLSHRFKAL